MKLSLVVCEGRRDRVVISRVLAKRYGWVPIEEKAAKDKNLFTDRPFVDGRNGRALLKHPKDGRVLAILERSRTEQADTIGKMIRYNHSREPRWERLLVVFDSDGRDAPSGLDESNRAHTASLFAHAHFPLAGDPLRDWTAVAAPIPDLVPPGAVPVQVRAHALPGSDEPGSLESLLLAALGEETHRRLIAHLREALQAAKGLKTDYMAGAGELEKALTGAVLSVLLPDLRHHSLERRIGDVPWEDSSSLLLALSGLADL